MKKTKTIHPIHIFLFMGSCMLALALISIIMPAESSIEGNVIHAPQLTQVLEMEEDSLTDTIPLPPTEDVPTPVAVVTTDTCVPTPVVAAVAPPAAVPTTATAIDTPSESVVPDTLETSIDTRIYLTAFSEALQQASTQPIRIVHYGDSQIEEDRITTQVRRAFQQQYGGGGVGLIPLHQTIPTSTLIQSIQINGVRQQISQGPKRYLVYGPSSMRRKSSHYGPMGQVAIMDNELVTGSEDILLQVESGSKGSERYFNRIRIVQSGGISVSVAPTGSQQGDMFIVPDSTRSVTIHLQGKGEVYGISLETNTGITVDNVPMRGSSGAVFTSIASSELQQYYKETNTKLIIMQYGGNIMPYTRTREQVMQYIEKMRRQIQYLRYLAPESSIVFVGPSDMCENKAGTLQTYPMIPVIDRALLTLAQEEQIAYFSLYQHMGGKGSMVKWKEQGLAGGDYVHFTHKGAAKTGQMLAQWLLQASKL